MFWIGELVETGPQGILLWPTQAGGGLPQEHIRSFPRNPRPSGRCSGMSPPRLRWRLCHLLQRSEVFWFEFKSFYLDWSIAELPHFDQIDTKMAAVAIKMQHQGSKIGWIAIMRVLRLLVLTNISLHRGWNLPLQRENQGSGREGVWIHAKLHVGLPLHGALLLLPRPHVLQVRPQDWRGAWQIPQRGPWLLHEMFQI